MRKLLALLTCVGFLCSACYTKYQISLAELAKLEAGKEPPDVLLVEDGSRVPYGRVSTLTLAMKNGDTLPISSGAFRVSPSAIEILEPESRSVRIDLLDSAAELIAFSPGKTVALAVVGGVVVTVVIPAAIMLLTVQNAGQKSFSAD